MVNYHLCYDSPQEALGAGVQTGGWLIQQYNVCGAEHAHGKTQLEAEGAASKSTKTH